MQSPYTGNKMDLIREYGVELTFRNESFQIVYHFYQCIDSKECFTTTELDQINLAQVYSQYRKKHGKL